jgi:hypothetical protein
MMGAPLLLLACSPSPSRPPPQTIETVGVVRSFEEGANGLVVQFVEGRVWERPKGQYRVSYDFGEVPQLLVAGQDDQGTYIMLIGGLPWLPEDCRFTIGRGGREWGDAIETEGLLWPKSPLFSLSSLSVGTEYPKDVQFCLDEQARIESFVTRPQGSDEAPVGSARTN